MVLKKKGLTLPNPGIELGSPALQADSLPAELPGKPLITGYQQNYLPPYGEVLSPFK